jgi:hypothetical protein
MVGDGDTVGFGVGAPVSVVVGDGEGDVGAASRRSVTDGLGDGVGSLVGALTGVLVETGAGAIRWLLGGGV